MGQSAPGGLWSHTWLSVHAEGGSSSRGNSSSVGRSGWWTRLRATTAW